MQLSTCETPDFIAPTLRPASRPDLNPVDDRIWGKLHECVYGVLQLNSWRRPTEVTTDRRVGTMKQSGSGIHVFEVAFEHAEDVWTVFKYVWLLHSDSHMCLKLPTVDTSCFWENSVHLLWHYWRRIGQNPTLFARVIKMYTGGYFFPRHTVKCTWYKISTVMKILKTNKNVSHKTVQTSI